MAEGEGEGGEEGMEARLHAVRRIAAHHAHPQRQRIVPARSPAVTLPIAIVVAIMFKV